MKHVLLLVAGILWSVQSSAAQGMELEDQKMKTSYSIGLEVARNFKKNEVDFDQAAFAQGMADGVSGERPLLREKEYRRILTDFQTQVRQRMSSNLRTLALQNRKKSDAFLLENKSQPGVVSMPSGLQYRIVQAGAGPRPTETDWVLVNYRGMLLNGTEFDGTDAGKPGKLDLLQLFTGLKEALKLLPAGSRSQVWIPPQLAYGDRGVGTDIGPNELLTYDIEVVGVEPNAQRR